MNEIRAQMGEEMVQRTKTNGGGRYTRSKLKAETEFSKLSPGVLQFADDRRTYSTKRDSPFPMFDEMDCDSEYEFRASSSSSSSTRSHKYSRYPLNKRKRKLHKKVRFDRVRGTFSTTAEFY